MRRFVLLLAFLSCNAMAQRKASSKSTKPATVTGATSVMYRAFTKRLRELGCIVCPECFAYVWPDHVHGTVRHDEAA